MPLTKQSDTVVVIDDEIHNMVWMIDYLESLSLKVATAENVNDALALVDKAQFRALIVDLNIPVFPPLEHVVESMGPAFASYPGLYVADRARNAGYRGRQVMLYSVHRDPMLADIVHRLGISYIMKGRPHEIKTEVDSVLSFDPTANH